MISPLFLSIPFSDRPRTITFADKISITPSVSQPPSEGGDNNIIPMPLRPGSTHAQSLSSQTQPGAQHRAALPPTFRPPNLVSVPLPPPPIRPLLPPSLRPLPIATPAPFPATPYGAPPGPPPGPPPANIRALSGGVLVRQPANIRALAGGVLVRQFGSALENLPAPMAPPQSKTFPRPPIAPFCQPSVLSSGPKLLQQLHVHQEQQQQPSQPQCLAKGPTKVLTTTTTTTSKTSDDGATIVATPVLRTKLNPDVTRFTPTSVKVKRSKQQQQQQQQQQLVRAKKAENAETEEGSLRAPTQRDDPRLKAEMTDMAYEDFMKEIEGLM